MKPTFRSSELDRVLSCNGSITLVPLVNQREGDEGDEGTMIHWMIADRAIRELGALGPEGGLPAPEVPKGYVLPKSSLWMVDWAIRHIQETIPADWCLMVEVEMWFEFGRWINKGHADIVATSPDGKKAKGKDWKTGRDPVDPADNNEQIGSYMGLIKCEWPTVEEVEFEICQPRISDDDENGFERVSKVVITDMPLLVSTMDRRVCAAMDNAMQLKTGKQCRWCSAAIQCPAMIAQREIMKITLTNEAIAAIKRQPDDSTLADWAVASKELAGPIKDATDMAKKRISEAGGITATDGTSITAKTEGGAYSVPDPEKFLAALRVVLPKDSDLAKVVTFSQTRIKDRISEVMNIKKTGSDSVTAESVHAAHLRPLVEQGTRTRLIFS